MIDITLNSIDEMLGDKEKRFFSNGYKNIQHDISNILFYPQESLLKAEGCALYPLDWSTKINGINLKPHLSTLDVFIFSLYANVFFIHKAYQLDTSSLKDIWIEKVLIKAGSEAVLDVSKVSIESKLMSTNIKENSKYQYTSTFQNNIQGFKVEVVLNHSIHKICSQDASFEKLDKQDYWYFEHTLLNKNRSHDIKNVHINLGYKSISSHVQIHGQPCTPSNMEEENASIFSLIDIFVNASQSMQALIYSLDGIDRKCSNNLWMRKIEFQYASPVKVHTLKQYALITKTAVLSIKDKKWRLADFEYGLDLSSNPVLVKASLAHELPVNLYDEGKREFVPSHHMQPSTELLEV